VDKRLKYGAVALLMGLCSGAGAAFLRHRTDTSFRTPVDVSERLGVRVLGSVQEVPPGELPINGMHARLIEPIRGISTALLAASPEQQTHVRLITSPTPASGKSSLSVQLARSLAATGRRVLLIDGDNHGQGTTRRFDMLGEPGLAEFLEGAVRAEDVMREIQVPSLQFLPSGRRNENFGEALSGQAAQDRLAQLCQGFSEVILDSPPVLVKSDALILATLVDEVVLVLRAGVSRAGDTFAAQQCLSAVGAKVVGVILNAVSPRNVRYAYGYSYHYNYPYNGAYAVSDNGPE
jgi:capsular exopolysaccharide synthesis family protein